PDTRHIFVDVGLGFHVEFTWPEALNFISAREEKLARQIEEHTQLIASIKAQIKMATSSKEKGIVAKIITASTLLIKHSLCITSSGCLLHPVSISHQVIILQYPLMMMATLGLSTNLCGNNQCQLQQFLSPLYRLPISHSNSITAHYQQKIHLLIILLYVIFVFHFSIFATASITYSTFHGFYNRPVCFISSIRYILFSIFPLLLTVVASLIILIFVFIIFGLLGALVYEGLLILGVEVDYGSNYLLILVVRVPILVLVATFYLQVEWSLAHVVVVVEYKWGFAPLKRSAYLIKGNEWIAAILEIVLCSVLMTMMLSYFAAHTVLYIYWLLQGFTWGNDI
ncbi:Hypothetical predicted protein, partial [Olea europaea subsp. europaea]